MPFDLTRSELAAYAACCVLVVLLGWRVLRSDAHGASSTAGAAAAAATPGRSAPDGAASAPTVSAAPPAGETTATVHVVGAVQRAGVYRLRTGQRIQDAIRRAGGATGAADLQAINLAAKVADGQQVVVPRKGRGAAAAGGGDTATASGAGGGAGASPSGPGGAPVNLNSATAEQLDTLDGVGPATATKILEFRQQHGGFSSVDELGQITGIGPKRLESLRAQVTV